MTLPYSSDPSFVYIWWDDSLLKWLKYCYSASLPPTAQSSSFWKDFECDQNSLKRSSPISSPREVSEGTIYAAELWDSEIVEKKRKGIFRLEADFWDHYFKVEKFHLDIMENMPACLWTVWDFKS